MEKEGIVKISWSSLWRLLFFLIFATVLFLGRRVLVALFLAIIISAGLEEAVTFLERRKIPRTLGVILIFLAAALFLLFVLYAMLPLVIADLNLILTSLQDGSNEGWLRSITSFDATQSVNSLIKEISTSLFSDGVSPFGVFSQVLGGLALAASVLVGSFYLSLTRDGVPRFIRLVFPMNYEAVALRIYERSRRKISSWFRTQLLLSLIMGFLVGITLLILGVKHAILIGVLAGIFEIVPYVGPIFSGALAMVVSLESSVALAFYTLIAFLALNQLESHFLVPILTKRAVGLHPVIVIVAMLLGAQVGGFLGLIVAVPAAAVLQESIEELSEKGKS